MTSLFSAQVGPLPAVLLVLLSVICAITDLWKGKIYNVVTYTAIALGFALHIALGGFSGFWTALGGFAIGFFPPFILFALGGMQGGDVKILGAVGTIAGGIAATEALILAFFIGGFIALAKLAWHGELFRSLGRMLRVIAGFLVPGLPRVPLVDESKPKRTIRFGFAVSLATLATLYDLRSGALSALVLG